MAPRKKDLPPATLALSVHNLSPNDVYELERELALITKAKACQENIQAQQIEITRLKNQKIAIEKKIKENKGGNRQGNTKKKEELSPEQVRKIEEEAVQAKKDTATAAEINKKIRAYEGAPKISCRIRHPGCVEAMNVSKILWPKAIAEEINRKNGTDIDFNELLDLEGGEFTQAYIPWWPYIKNGLPKIEAMKNSSGAWEARLVGDYGGEPDNRSGTTIGVGIDLGQFDQVGFEKMMKKWNVGELQISVDELDVIAEKIKPYYGKIGAEACAFLKANPLRLNEKETNFLDMVSQNAAVHDTLLKYDAWLKGHKGVNKIPFAELAKEKQTALLSHTYQYGTPLNDVMKIILGNDSVEIPNIRERDYLLKAIKRN
jgi:hypothetical protein